VAKYFKFYIYASLSIYKVTLYNEIVYTCVLNTESNIQNNMDSFNDNFFLFKSNIHFIFIYISATNYMLLFLDWFILSFCLGIYEKKLKHYKNQIVNR